MPLGEQTLRSLLGSPANYGRRVWCLGAIYVALDATAAALTILIVWRGRHLVTLAQRSNVETLLLLIVLVLSLYYLATTWRGACGAVRMAWYNLPYLWDADAGRIESRKHALLAPGGHPLAACIDKLVRFREDPARPVQWSIGDDSGALGTLAIEGAVVSFLPRKDGVNNSIFEYWAEQLQRAMAAPDADPLLEIVFWTTIDNEGAAIYRSTVTAFENLAAHLHSDPLWPCLYLTPQVHRAIADALRAVTPALRNEALLPDVEYEVEYSVPILPEPLALVQLRRHERRADPVLTMGYALAIMLLMLMVTALLIWFPPWVPSK